MMRFRKSRAKSRPPGEWYVMSDVEIMNLVGTHIEAPFHCLQDGADLATIPVDQLAGEAVVLDLRNAEAEVGVSLSPVKDEGAKAGAVRPGDIEFGMMGPSKYFSTAGLERLVEREIKLLGVDPSGMELPDDASHANVNHPLLFRTGIRLIENLTNLEQLSRQRVQVHALVVPIKRLDVFPLRVVAVED